MTSLQVRKPAAGPAADERTSIPIYSKTPVIKSLRLQGFWNLCEPWARNHSVVEIKVASLFSGNATAVNQGAKCHAGASRAFCKWQPWSSVLHSSQITYKHQLSELIYCTPNARWWCHSSSEVRFGNYKWVCFKFWGKGIKLNNTASQYCKYRKPSPINLKGLLQFVSPQHTRWHMISRVRQRFVMNLEVGTWKRWTDAH